MTRIAETWSLSTLFVKDHLTGTLVSTMPAQEEIVELTQSI